MSVDSVGPPNFVPPFPDFNDWFASVIHETTPTMIIGIARAAIRLLQLHRPPVGLIPIQSQHALPFVGDYDLNRKNILLFDDSVVFGSTMNDVREYLVSRGAIVSSASYVVDRTSFFGEIRPNSGSVAEPSKSPHSWIPLKYRHRLWPSLVRQHHSALVSAILGSLNHYNFDFPTFQLKLPTNSFDEIPFYVKALGDLPGVTEVRETASIASTQKGVYRYSALMNSSASALFSSNSVGYREHLKLRVLFAPAAREARITVLPQLTLGSSSTFSDVAFKSRGLANLWQMLEPPRDGDRWYSQALLRLLGIFVGCTLGEPLVRIFASAVLGRQPQHELCLMTDELKIIIGTANSFRLSENLGQLGQLGSERLSSTTHSSGLVSPELEDETLSDKILQAWAERPALKPHQLEPLYSATSRVLLSLREVTDKPDMRTRNPRVSRLEQGLTFIDIDKLLKTAGISVSPNDLSIAVDLCVDNGQAVPKVIQRGSNWLRVFYSGENFNATDLQQLEHVVNEGYKSLGPHKTKKNAAADSPFLLSPFDIHKLLVFLKDLLPWLPISTRYYTFGRQALVGRDKDDIVPWLTERATAPLRLVRVGTADMAGLNPDFHPFVKQSWPPDRYRDFLDGFQYGATAFQKLPSDAKLLVSTCRTHRHTFNAVALEAHSWASHSRADFPHFLALIATLKQGISASDQAIGQLYWSVEYIAESLKKWNVFHRHFQTLEAKVKTAFRRQGPAAERFWEYKVHAPGILNSSAEPEVTKKFETLMSIVALMRWLTVYTVKILEEAGNITQARLEREFVEHGISLKKGDHSWLVGSTRIEAAKGYNDIATAAPTPGKTILVTRLDESRRDFSNEAQLTETHELIRNAAREIAEVLYFYCPHYDVIEGEFPFLPSALKRLRQDGSTELILRDVWVLTMDIVCSTDDPETSQFKLRILALLEGSLKGRGHFERTGNDQYIACCNSPTVLLELAQVLANEGRAAASTAKSLRGTRKALSFGSVKVIANAQGGEIFHDVDIPNLLPKAFYMLKAVDSYDRQAGEQINDLIALEEGTCRRFSQELGLTLNDGTRVEVNEKHFKGKCLVFPIHF